jgi:hypothetical protein
MNIFQRIIRIFALFNRKKELQNQLEEFKGDGQFSDGLQKNVVSDGVDVTFDTAKKELIDNVKSGVSAIVIQTNCEPEKLLDYVKISKTPVYRINCASKILKNIKEETGFICEKYGLEALYLSIITFSGFSLKTPPMFIIENKTQDRLDILYHFYKWYSMKSGLSGFEYETQKMLKKYYNNPELLSYNRLKLEKIVKLQEAISRDNEATNFVLEYEKKTSVSKKVSDKISQDGSASV